MAEKETKGDRIEKELKEMREELKASRAEVAALKRGIENINSVDIHEAKALLEAEKPLYPCPKCNSPLEEGETPCKNCGEEIKWEA